MTGDGEANGRPAPDDRGRTAALAPDVEAHVSRRRCLAGMGTLGQRSARRHRGRVSSRRPPMRAILAQGGRLGTKGPCRVAERCCTTKRDHHRTDHRPAHPPEHKNHQDSVHSLARYVQYVLFGLAYEAAMAWQRRTTRIYVVLCNAYRGRCVFCAMPAACGHVLCNARGRGPRMTANGEARWARGRRVPAPPRILELPGSRFGARRGRLPRVQEADAGLVAQLARLRDEESRLRKAIAEDGEIQRRPIQNAKGEVIAEEVHMHPGLAMLRRIGREAVEAASELGLSPAGRRRLGLETPPEPREPDALDRLREQRDLRRHEGDERASLPREPFLLAHLAGCGQCGGYMITASPPRRDGTRRRAYVCNEHRHQRCTAPPVDAMAVDHVLVASLSRFLGGLEETEPYRPSPGFPRELIRGQPEPGALRSCPSGA